MFLEIRYYKRIQSFQISVTRDGKRLLLYLFKENFTQATLGFKLHGIRERMCIRSANIEKITQYETDDERFFFFLKKEEEEEKKLRTETSIDRCNSLRRT